MRRSGVGGEEQLLVMKDVTVKGLKGVAGEIVRLMGEGRGSEGDLGLVRESLNGGKDLRWEICWHSGG